MTKKLLIVVICLVTVCAVLGLNDRLNYDGLRVSMAMVQADVTDVKNDVYMLGLFGNVIEDYSPTVTQTLSIRGGSSEGGSFMGYIQYRCVDQYGNVITEKSYGGTWSRETCEKYVQILTPLLGSAQAPAGTLEYVGFAISVVYTFVWVVLAFLFDCFGVAWSLVEASFYLLGF